MDSCRSGCNMLPLMANLVWCESVIDQQMNAFCSYSFHTATVFTRSYLPD
jgi:hypothetical protein